MSDGLTPLDAAYVAARWGWFLAGFVVLGATLFPPPHRSSVSKAPFESSLRADTARRAARVGIFGAALLLLTGVVRLYLQAHSFLDPGEPVTREFLDAVLDTSWGRGWTTQTGWTVLALTAFPFAARGQRAGWVLTLAAGFGIAASAGDTGHAVGAAEAGRWGPLADAVHFAAGGYWLGTLAVLLLAGLGACRALDPARRPAAVRLLASEFSRTALVTGPLAMACGVWLAVLYLGWRWPLELLATVYGRVLLVKLLLLAGVAALGVHNWRRVVPRLGAPDGEGRLRRSIGLELALGILLLFATAVLVALPLPSEIM